MLELVDVHSFYGDAHVIHGVSLTVGRGEVVALLGRNGMGKTTTMRSIIPLVKSGTIHWNGSSLLGLPAHEIAARGIMIVPQGGACSRRSP
jgi:branched-chain amino acid transport system ATP-binding protein